MRKFGKSFCRALLFAALSVVAAAFVFAFAACSDGGAGGASGRDPIDDGGAQTAVYAFYAADGSEILSGSAAKGTEISAPAPPEREHCDFIGWGSEGEIVDFPYVLTGDREFTAVYSAKQYSYSFTADGAVVAEGKADALTELDSPSAPEKEHLDFVGWAEDGASEVTEFPYVLAGDVNFAAVYKTAVYEYSFVSGGVTVSSGEAEALTAIDAPADPYMEHYDFIGWTADGKAVTFPFVLEKDTVLTAEYSKKQYGYSFEADGETVFAGVSDALCEVTAPSDPEKEHYDLVGWSVDGKLVSFPYVLTGDTRFTAVFAVKSYEYSFVADGVTVSSGEAEALTEISAPADPHKDHYDFIGWTADGEAVSFPHELTGNTTFTAEFALTRYKITYELGGGTGDPLNPSYYTAETMSADLRDPVLPCRAFEGWYYDGGFSVPFGGAFPEECGDVTLHAKWSEPAHTFGTDHVCSVCGENAESPDHVYDGSHECVICGHETAGHEFENGVCVMCGYACEHTEYGEDHYCTVCGHYYGSDAHEYGEDHICVICGAAHSEHKYTEEHICEVCGAPHESKEHVYENGKCVVCGASEVWNGGSADAFASGSGTESDPYIVADAGQLAYLAELVAGGDTFAGKYVALGADIYLGGHEWTPIGNSGDDGYAFAGSFDGRGHTVYGMTVVMKAGADETHAAGLFGAVCGSRDDDAGVTLAASVKNVRVSGFSITLSSSEGASFYAGGLVGYARIAEIYCCASDGGISVASSGASRVGGLIGAIEDTNKFGSVRDCSAYVSISATGGAHTASGFVGYAEMCDISYCVAVSEIVSSGSGAGFAVCGERGDFSHCFAQTEADTEGSFAACVSGGRERDITDCLYGSSSLIGGVPASDLNADPVGGAEEAVALWEGETTLAVSGETVIPSVFAEDSAATEGV